MLIESLHITDKIKDVMLFQGNPGGASKRGQILEEMRK